VIRSTDAPRAAEEWALVLAAAGIPHVLEPGRGAWRLSVLDEDVVRGRIALHAFDVEQAAHAVIPVAAVDRGIPWFLGVLAGSLLLAGFVLTGTPGAGSRWFDRGAAIAGLMRAEPWRAVTALTLHLDVAHVAGNAVATAVLLPAVAQRLGAGVGLLAVILAGALGNMLAALAHTPAHAAVGASTATFAAVGMLGALRLIRAPGDGRRRWKSWTIPAASLLLLALLGTGRGSDVLAHATGFLSGAAVGVAAAFVRQPSGALAQWTAGVLTVATVAGCWLRAGWG
jgi:membrane associated rhomboid family serine protease